MCMKQLCDVKNSWLTTLSSNCLSPPPSVISVKQQREKYRQRLFAAFEGRYHPDYSVPRYDIFRPYV
jgi:hypothetical protein